MKRLGVGSILALVMVVSACSNASGSDPTVLATTTTTTESAAVAPTTSAPATTTTTVAATPLDALGYPVSDEWVVETVVVDIDSATGGLAIDADGVMYQSDFGYQGHPGNSIYRISPDGAIETLIQSDLMASLTMITFGPDGTLYQSSYGSNRVFRINPDGTADVIAEGLRGPTGIVVLEDGTLVVEAYNSSILHRIHPDGTVEDWVTDRRFNGINGLTKGPDGTLYAIDHKDGSIFSIDAEGTVDKIFQFPKQTSHGVYLDGSLFVTSRGGYVVFRYDLATGFAEIIAGNGEPGDADGRGSESAFGRPNAITVGADGALYINHGRGQDNDPVSIKRISHQP
jgi:sugar lactone lactonase YvrE